MSIHSSLRGVNTLTGRRSVWTRIERIQRLMKKGRFNPEQDSVYGLPKVRTSMKSTGGKKKKKKEEGAKEGAEGTEAAEAKPAEKA